MLFQFSFFSTLTFPIPSFLLLFPEVVSIMLLPTTPSLILVLASFSAARTYREDVCTTFYALNSAEYVPTVTHHTTRSDTIYRKFTSTPCSTFIPSAAIVTASATIVQTSTITLAAGTDIFSSIFVVPVTSTLVLSSTQTITTTAPSVTVTQTPIASTVSTVQGFTPVALETGYLNGNGYRKRSLMRIEREPTSNLTERLAFPARHESAFPHALHNGRLPRYPSKVICTEEVTVVSTHTTIVTAPLVTATAPPAKTITRTTTFTSTRSIPASAVSSTGKSVLHSSKLH